MRTDPWQPSEREWVRALIDARCCLKRPTLPKVFAHQGIGYAGCQDRRLLHSSHCIRASQTSNLKLAPRSAAAGRLSLFVPAALSTLYCGTWLQRIAAAAHLVQALYSKFAAVGVS